MADCSIKNIARVIEYIEAHLTEKLVLDKVADAVHYSKYHLHRMFTNKIGMTMHDYLKRRRLTEAAKLLVFSDKAIIDIALITGYESQQAFTKIFTAMYKMPPNKYRENEKFYPLQLKFRLEGSFDMTDNMDDMQRSITWATEEDISCWMELVRLIVDGFPYLNEEDYVQTLKKYIRSRQALILKDGGRAVGIMLFSFDQGSIDFMGSHPLYRNRGVAKAFLQKVMKELLRGRDLSITTYREGDRADTGQRQEIKGLGFAEAELLTEYGYQTQRFTIAGEDSHD